jgi:histidinol dehydrogenase
VRAIVDDVRAGGWDAAVRHALRLDGAAPERVHVAPIAEEARRTLTHRAAARDRSRPAEHHRLPQGQPAGRACGRDDAGLIVRKVWRALDRVGLYVPGGATPLFSTLLMLACPPARPG